MRKKTNLLAFIICSVVMSSCCVLMPSARTSNVSVTVSPSNAEILSSSGRLLGKGSATIHFDCDDDKGDYYTITMKANGYRTKTERIYNWRYDYSKSYTLEQKINTYVKVFVTPSDAEIRFDNGNLAGTGSCELKFDEDDSSNSYYELTLDAPNHYSRKVKVYKNGGNKSFSLERKPIKTVLITPNDAEILVDNEPRRSDGKILIDFDAEQTDKVLITGKAVGYEEKSFYLSKNDPEQTIRFTLDPDEAYKNSLDESNSSQYLNKPIPVHVRNELTMDDAWGRLIGITKRYFPNLEIWDKSTGWIRTLPRVERFGKYEVRTTLEILRNYVETYQLSYTATVTSSIRKYGEDDRAWKPYPRLSMTFEQLIPDLQRSVGAGGMESKKQ